MLQIFNTGSLNVGPAVFSLYSPFVFITESYWMKWPKDHFSIIMN